MWIWKFITAAKLSRKISTLECYQINESLLCRSCTFTFSNSCYYSYAQVFFLHSHFLRIWTTCVFEYGPVLGQEGSLPWAFGKVRNVSESSPNRHGRVNRRPRRGVYHFDVIAWVTSVLARKTKRTVMTTKVLKTILLSRVHNGYCRIRLVPALAYTVVC